MPTGLLSLADVSPYQFSTMLDLAHEIKQKPGRFHKRLKHCILGEIKGPPAACPPALSFHQAVAALGGRYISHSFHETAKINLFTLRHLEAGLDGLISEAFPHSLLNQWVLSLKMPLINNGSDTFHPCRVLADIFTLKEEGLDLNSLKITYIGGVTPVLNSLIQGLSKTGSSLKITCPENSRPDPALLKTALNAGIKSGFSVKMEHDPEAAYADTDVLYTDCGWQHKAGGGESEKFRITAETVKKAGNRILVLHGHSLAPGPEIETAVLEGPQSAVLNQWENTLHIQKAIMVLLLGMNK
jgi:ornithine carbamoyltransferase